MYSLEQAKNYVLNQVLKYDAAADPGDRPQIIDEHTLTRKFGWVFIYNNEAYLSSGQRHLSWGGPGPILFNKETGEVRRFNATFDMEIVAEDYEKELEAGDGCWVLTLEPCDAKQIAIALKSIFGMSGPDALRHTKRIPGPIFKGVWRTLTEFAPQIPGAAVELSMTKEPELPELKPHGRGKWILA
ncbi:MAG TPA: hypothetical protein VE954_31450 [Oligoflexus sp.]|uniref:hypothetical protein n=1 Tax=Oligoflexus sp. TaxID=1971216 RepID=UPI002D29394F|nr:hypothetical protein [Oligoflexus sp.]HYX37641.1 hypothetical protein [Oligoflexus sp.]